MTKSIPTARQTIHNFLAIWANRVLAIVSMLITTPLIMHKFGLELTGVWLMITQLISHLSLLDVGLGNILVRFLAAEKATNNTAKGTNYLATCFYLLVGIGLLLLVSAPFLTTIFVQSLQVAPRIMLGVPEIVLLSIVSTAVSLPMRVGHGLLTSIHRFDRLKLMDSITIALKLILIFCVFKWFTPGIIILGSIVFGTTLLSTMIVFFSGLKLNNSLSLHPAGFSKSAVYDLSSMGGSALIITFAAIILTQSTSMVAGYALGPALVPIVAYPLMIYTALTPFMAALQTIITPVAAAMFAKKEEQQLFSMFVIAVRYQTSAAFFLLLGFLIFGHPLLMMWLSGPQLNGQEIGVISKSVVILFVGYAFSSVGQIGRSIMTSAGGHWPAAIVELSTALAGAVAGYLFSRFSALGVLGIPVGVSLALIVRGLIFYPYYLARFFSTSPVVMLVKGLGGPLVIVTVTAAGSLVLQALFAQAVPSANRGLLTVVLAVTFPVWYALTWKFIINQNHKQVIKEMISMYCSVVVCKFLRCANEK